MEKIKLCKDCKWSKWNSFIQFLGGEEWSRCYHPKLIDRSPITGTETPASCCLERKITAECGPDGDLWEAK